MLPSILMTVCKGVSTQARKHGYFLSSLAMAISKYKSFFIEIMSPSNLMTVCKGVQAYARKQWIIFAITGSGNFKR
jgi:hypothetical protein